MIALILRNNSKLCFMIIFIISGKFRSESFDEKYDPGQDVYIGTQLFVQLEWAVRLEGFSFFIENCAMIQDEDRMIKMIDQNCYSRTLEAQLSGDSHLSSHGKCQFR